MSGSLETGSILKSETSEAQILSLNGDLDYFKYILIMSERQVISITCKLEQEGFKI